MIDIPIKIFKKYKQLNIFNMVYGKAAWLIKSIMIVATIVFAFWYGPHLKVTKH